MSRPQPKRKKTPAGSEPEFKPVVRYSPVLVPAGNGEFLLKPGKPVVMERDAEVSTAEFARMTGLSQRHVITLCNEGRITARKRSPLHKSEWRIASTELARYLGTMESEEREPRK